MTNHQFAYQMLKLTTHLDNWQKQHEVGDAALLAVAGTTEKAAVSLSYNYLTDVWL